MAGEAWVTFEWLRDRAFLIQRWVVSAAFDGIAVIGPSEQPGTFHRRYFDGRGEHGIYEMTVRDGIWTQQRDAPDSFPQRFSAAIEEGGSVITGGWEKRQGGSWEPDIDVTYQRAIWLSIDHVRIPESLTTAPKYPRECVRSVDWYQPRS